MRKEIIISARQRPVSRYASMPLEYNGVVYKKLPPAISACYIAYQDGCKEAPNIVGCSPHSPDGSPFLVRPPGGHDTCTSRSAQTLPPGFSFSKHICQSQPLMLLILATFKAIPSARKRGSNEFMNIYHSCENVCCVEQWFAPKLTAFRPETSAWLPSNYE